MRPWPVVKGVLLGLLLIGACGAMCFGAVLLVIGLLWQKGVGLVLLAGGFRAVIFFLDTVWERPPQFTGRPWERPWEKDDPGR